MIIIIIVFFIIYTKLFKIIDASKVQLVGQKNYFSSESLFRTLFWLFRSNPMLLDVLPPKSFIDMRIIQWDESPGRVFKLTTNHRSKIPYAF